MARRSNPPPISDDSANRETPRSATCHAGSRYPECTRTPTLAYARTLVNARIHAHTHTNVRCASARARKHARSRTLTCAGVPAPRPAPVAHRRHNARRGGADARTDTGADGRPSSHGSAVPPRMGKPSMPKHIVVPSMWTVCFTIHFTGLHDMPVDILA